MNNNDLKRALAMGAGALQDGLASSKTPAAARASVLRHDMQHLLGWGKKPLAREVIRLTDLLHEVLPKDGVGWRAKRQAGPFEHAEAFRLMNYVLEEGPEDAPDSLLVWNSRDGVTPFNIHLGGASYHHDMADLRGPFFDLPEQFGITHVWVTRTDREVLEAWCRTIDMAADLGRITKDRADAVRGSLEAAKSWNYHIGLRDLATGEFTDKLVLQAARDKAAQAEATRDKEKAND